MPDRAKAVLHAVVIAASTVDLQWDRLHAAAAKLAGWLKALASNAGNATACTVMVQMTIQMTVKMTVHANQSLTPAAASACFQVSCAGECTATANGAHPQTNGARVYAIAMEPRNATARLWTPRAGVLAKGANRRGKITRHGKPPLPCLRVSFASASTAINTTASATNRSCSIRQKR